MAYSSLTTRRLGRRLLLAVGATPLGASFLQGCRCPEPPDLEVTIDELVDMQDAVRLGMAQREADCFGAGTGGSGGMIGLGGGDGFGANSPGGVGGLGGAAGLGGLGELDGGGNTAGSNPICDEVLPDWVTRPPWNWYVDEWYRPQVDEALSWVPGSGCPTPSQFDTLRHTLIHTEPQAVELVSSTEGTCVYDQIQYCSGGRPFLVSRTPRMAPLLSKTSVEVSLDDTERALVAAWCADAQMEHASIAAFARLCLQLMALGAPLPLVREAQAASLDEAEHTKLCLEQAERHGGGPYAWGALDVGDACTDLRAQELLVTNIIEGCIGETLAAARARAQAECAVDPELSRRLHALADDEERHAALAWNILRWQLASADEVQKRLALAIFQSQVPRGAATEAPHEADARWREAGRLRAAEAADIDLSAWTEAVVPLAQLVFFGEPAAATSGALTRSPPRPASPERAP